MSSDDLVIGDFSAIRLPTQPAESEDNGVDKQVIDPTFLNDNPEWKAAREQVVSKSSCLTKTI